MRAGAGVRGPSDSPAGRYVLAVCGAFARSAAAEPPPTEGPVRERVLELLESHNLLGALGPLMLAAGMHGTEENALRKRILHLNRRHGLIWLELSRLVAALDGAGVAHVVLKGLALGQTVYPRPEHRFVSDMDVLVPKAAFDDALAVVERLGYRLSPTLRPVSFYRRYHFHLILRGPARVSLELHWNLSRGADYFQFDTSGFLERSRTIDREGTRLHVPSDADQLLHCACQALKEDGYSDLRRILDAALLLGQGAARAPGLAVRARQQGMATPLWLLLEVQRELLGIRGGEELARELRPGFVVRRCLTSLEVPRHAVARGQAPERSGLKRLVQWLSAPSARAGLRQVRRFLFPGEAELLDSVHTGGTFDWATRARITASHSISLLKLATLQVWRLARSAFSHPP